MPYVVRNGSAVFYRVIKQSQEFGYRAGKMPSVYLGALFIFGEAWTQRGEKTTLL